MLSVILNKENPRIFIGKETVFMYSSINSLINIIIFITDALVCGIIGIIIITAADIKSNGKPIFSKKSCASIKIFTMKKLTFSSIFAAFILQPILFQRLSSIKFSISDRIFYNILAILLLALCVIDLNIQEIPNGLNLLIALLGAAFLIWRFSQIPDKNSFVFNIIKGDKNSAWNPNVLIDGIFGALTGFLPLFLINEAAKLLLKKDGMGGGDMKLMAGIGLFLGFKCVILSLLMGCVFGLIYSLIMIKSDKMSKETAFAFGPHISAAALLTFVYGNHIITWYLNLLSF